MKQYNHQNEPDHIVPGWFDPETDQDKRDAKTLCALVAGKQKTMGEL